MTGTIRAAFGALAAVSAFFAVNPAARANVYATDIRLNGSVSNANLASVTPSSPVAITYRLNQPATGGCTVNILSGANNVAVIVGGTNMGLNTVLWGGTNNSGAPVAGGAFAVSITAAATGFSNWTQISIDTNAGMPANYPLGIDVDKNTNSPYYGRVVMGNAFGATGGNIPTNATLVGLYKMNADGSQAEEGWFGDAGYSNDDGGDSPTAGQMPDSGGYDPMIIRIGDDDRIYWVDDSAVGAIVACDILATTNQMVINEGPDSPGHPESANNYSSNPDFDDLVIGIQDFDVAFTTTTNASVWLCDADAPANWGVWMYHLKNGAADPADTKGTQAVTTGHDLARGSTGGCMVDTNLDIFAGQNLKGETAAYNAMEFTNWHGGLLPPEAVGTNDAIGTYSGEVEWGFGCAVDTTCATNPTFEAVRDSVLNSRTNPTILACPMSAGSNDVNGSGIRLLNATNGSIILTNLDFGQQYTAAAFDNVGNLYGASTSRNLWRVWSPPGSNQATTVAVPQIILPMPFTITGISTTPTGEGCAVVTITFTAPGNPAASLFTLLSSPTVNGTYTSTAASITGSSGVYQATVTNCSTEFYLIKEL